MSDPYATTANDLIDALSSLAGASRPSPDEVLAANEIARRVRGEKFLTYWGPDWDEIERIGERLVANAMADLCDAEYERFNRLGLYDLAADAANDTVVFRSFAYGDEPDLSLLAERSRVNAGTAEVE